MRAEAVSWLETMTMCMPKILMCIMSPARVGKIVRKLREVRAITKCDDDPRVMVMSGRGCTRTCLTRTRAHRQTYTHARSWWCWGSRTEHFAPLCKWNPGGFEWPVEE